MSVITDLENIVGPEHVLVDEMAQPYLTDWRQRIHGRAQAVVRPGCIDELQAIVKYCQCYDIPMVPQGGNTSLCGAATPSNKGDAVVIVMTRFDRIIAVDTINDTITVEAGCTLQQVQDAARQEGRLFPLSLAAQGSCTIGGNIATNAGGTQVLRYGNMRDLVLGVQAVMPDGDRFDGLRGLRKDNTGYSLRDLLVGSEGTLGIITAAVLKLYPLPKWRKTALVALPDISSALALLKWCKQSLAADLTAFELISGLCLRTVHQVFPQMPIPFADTLLPTTDWFVLLELSEFESEQHAQARFEQTLQTALEQELILDAVVSESEKQAQALWHIRESIPLAEHALGTVIKHDIGVPISALDQFVKQTQALLAAHFPTCQLVVFGHVGDGNLHFNVAPRDPQQDLLVHQKQIFKLVFDSVASFAGTISAEHGIGSVKRDLLTEYKSENELYLMRKIKRALDPYHLMNPGKVISSVDI